MASRHLTVVILVAFAASAVFGLCAMAGDMVTHGGLCAQSGASAVLCSSNPLRALTFFALLGLLVSVAVAFASAPVRGAMLAATGPPVRRTDTRSAVPLPLAWAFADGILNPKAF